MRASGAQARPAAGFTLIELLVVIAIIAILIALLTPAVGVVRQEHQRVAEETARAIASAQRDFSANDRDSDGDSDHGTLAELLLFTDLRARLGGAFSGERDGYRFTVTLSPDRRDFVVCAEPVDPDLTHDAVIKIDASGQLDFSRHPAAVEAEAAFLVRHLPLIQELEGLAPGGLDLEPVLEVMVDDAGRPSPLLLAALDADGDGRIRIGELRGRDWLSVARSLGGAGTGALGSDAQLRAILDPALSDLLGRLDPSLDPVILQASAGDPAGILASALGHRISFGEARVSRCGEMASLPVYLDTSEPAAGFQLGFTWTGAGAVAVVGVVPGADIPAGGIQTFFANVERADRGLAARQAVVGLALAPGVTLPPRAAYEVLRVQVRAAAGAAPGAQALFCLADGLGDPPIRTVVSVRRATAESAVPLTGCGTATVTDDEAPPEITCPAAVEAEGGSDGADVSWDALVSATDNCAVASLTCDPPSGSRFSDGITTVRCTAADLAGNTASCSFDVVVRSSRSSFRRGDANADTVIDVSDVIATFGHLYLGDAAPTCLDAADANDDQQVDVSDGVYTLGYLFLGERAPGAPGPTTCGADPTPGGLAFCEYPPCR